MAAKWGHPHRLYPGAAPLGAAAVINIVLNLALIPPFGQVGAAAATLLAYVALVGLYYRRAQIVYPTPYRAAVVAATFVAGLALMPIGAIEYAVWWTALPVKLAAVLAFLAALRVIGVVGRGDAGRAVAWVRAR